MTLPEVLILRIKLRQRCRRRYMFGVGNRGSAFKLNDWGEKREQMKDLPHIIEVSEFPVPWTPTFDRKLRKYVRIW